MRHALLLLAPSIGIAFACDRPASRADSAVVDSVSIVRPLTAIDSGAPQFLPRDDANESFRAFRQQALDALARRDTAFLYRIVAPEIRISFGPGGGIEDFKKMWKTDDPTSGVWTTLARVLRMGGKHTTDTTFTAPYVFASWPDSLDAFEHVAVTASEALVFSAPAVQSTVLGTASHSILKVQEWRGLSSIPQATDVTWARVVLPGGQVGWMLGTDVYSPVFWRAFFARREGRWTMVIFVAGD